jgi:hypothetical protein
MKCFVRLPGPWQAVLIGLTTLLLVAIVEQETVFSHLVVFGLAVFVARGEWLRHRREKNQTSGRA